jgi:hypothetical protein
MKPPPPIIWGQPQNQPHFPLAHENGPQGRKEGKNVEWNVPSTHHNHRLSIPTQRRKRWVGLGDGWMSAFGEEDEEDDEKGMDRAVFLPSFLNE